MGVYLSTPKTDKLSEDGENDKLKFGLSSMQGWRASMEDAILTMRQHSLVFLMAMEVSTTCQDQCFSCLYSLGRVVAKFCAKYLHSQVLRSEAYSSGDLGTAVHRAFFSQQHICYKIIAKESQQTAYEFNGPHSDFDGPICGSTACVALVRNKQLVVANAGDSRCVISRGGQAYNLSRDHKPELVAERERIQKAGGFIRMGRINGSLNLSRAIGDMEFKQNKFLPPEKQIVTSNPDINVVELCDDDDFLVVACDGIWDCMSSQQLVDFIHEHIHTVSAKLFSDFNNVLWRRLHYLTAKFYNADFTWSYGCENSALPSLSGASAAASPQGS
ncbi:hypothetical protein ACQ4PT_037536 [Festuca glaucescens]